jgi:hypothetical protein
VGLKVKNRRGWGKKRMKDVMMREREVMAGREKKRDIRDRVVRRL